MKPSTPSAVRALGLDDGGDLESRALKTRIQYLSGPNPGPLDALVDSRAEVNLLNREVAARLKLKSRILVMTVNVFNGRLVEIFG